MSGGNIPCQACPTCSTSSIDKMDLWKGECLGVWLLYNSPHSPKNSLFYGKLQTQFFFFGSRVSAADGHPREEPRKNRHTLRSHLGVGFLAGCSTQRNICPPSAQEPVVESIRYTCYQLTSKKLVWTPSMYDTGTLVTLGQMIKCLMICHICIISLDKAHGPTNPQDYNSISSLKDCQQKLLQGSQLILGAQLGQARERALDRCAP